MGSLYEGKEIVDKTWGHTTYTCMICCGPNNPSMKFDPLDLVPNGSADQVVEALDSCTGKVTIITSDYPTWWTNDTTIATANGSQITGVGVGSTYHNAQSIYMYMGPRADSGGSDCPGSQDEEAAAINGAIPVNFRQTSATQLSNAYLRFQYVWDSSSGSLSDLGSCHVEEFVTYPGYVQGQNGQYYWASPPYTATFTPNPETGATPVSATQGSPGLTDTQGNVGFVKPYAANGVTSYQVFQFECPYFKSGQWVLLFPTYGNIPITRIVQDNNGTWQYSITKSNVAAIGNLP